MQATSSSGSDGSFKVDVTVALDNGEVFAIDSDSVAGGGGGGGGGGGAGYQGEASAAVIDVDPDDVIDV